MLDCCALVSVTLCGVVDDACCAGLPEQPASVTTMHMTANANPGVRQARPRPSLFRNARRLLFPSPSERGCPEGAGEGTAELRRSILAGPSPQRCALGAARRLSRRERGSVLECMMFIAIVVPFPGDATSRRPAPGTALRCRRN